MLAFIDPSICSLVCVFSPVFFSFKNLFYCFCLVFFFNLLRHKGLYFIIFDWSSCASRAVMLTKTNVKYLVIQLLLKKLCFTSVGILKKVNYTIQILFYTF